MPTPELWERNSKRSGAQRASGEKGLEEYVEPIPAQMYFSSSSLRVRSVVLTPSMQGQALNVPDDAVPN